MALPCFVREYKPNLQIQALELLAVFLKELWLQEECHLVEKKISDYTKFL